MKKRPALCAAVVFLSLNAALLQCQQLTVQTETGKQTVLAKDEIASLPHTKSRLALRTPQSPTKE